MHERTYSTEHQDRPTCQPVENESRHHLVHGSCCVKSSWGPEIRMCMSQLCDDKIYTRACRQKLMSAELEKANFSGSSSILAVPGVPQRQRRMGSSAKTQGQARQPLHSMSIWFPLLRYVGSGEMKLLPCSWYHFSWADLTAMERIG